MAKLEKDKHFILKELLPEGPLTGILIGLKFAMVQNLVAT